MQNVAFKAKRLKRGELFDFDQVQRQQSSGYFVLFLAGNEIILVISEDAIDHQVLVASLPRTFHYEYMLGGGRYMKVPKVFEGDSEWLTTWFSSTYGEIPRDRKLRMEIAQVITDGAPDVNLGVGREIQIRED